MEKTQNNKMRIGAGVLLVVIIGIVWFSVLDQNKKTIAFALDVFEAVEETNTMMFVGEVALNIAASGVSGSEDASDIEIEASFNGAFDERDRENPLSMMKIDIAVPDEFSGFLSSGSDSVNLEVRTIGTKIYIRLASFPDTPFFDLSDFVGQWVVLDQERIAELQGVAYDEDLLLSEEFEEIVLELIRDSIEKLVQSGGLRLDGGLGKETLSGVSVEGYEWEISLDALAIVFFELIEKLIESNVYGDSLTSEDLDFVDEYLTSNESSDFDELVDVSGEIWVGIDDNLPYRFLLDVFPKIGAEETLEGFGGLSLDIMVTSYDEPITIETPSESVDIIEVIQSLFGDFGVGAFQAGI